MLKNVSGKTKAELGSEAFAQLLNDNAARMADTVTEVDAYLETLQERGFVHKDYYTGNDLLTWRAQDDVVGFFAESAPELPFDDVAAGSWYYDDVAFVFGKGLMVGTGGGHFAPGARRDARHGREDALQHGKRARCHRRMPVCGRGVRQLL